MYSLFPGIAEQKVISKHDKMKLKSLFLFHLFIYFFSETGEEKVNIISTNLNVKKKELFLS